MKLHEMLQTKNKGEQEQRVEALMEAAKTPVATVMVQFDPRNGRTDIRVAGLDQPGIEDVKFVLRQAIDKLTAEAAALAAKNKQPEIPTAPPGNVPPEIDHNPT